MSYFLGIDIGTGSVKAVAVNLQGQSFNMSQEYYEFYVPHPGFHEQDPDSIWKAFKTTLKKVISKVGTQPSGIGLSSAMHSIIPVDELCIALGPMITWADNRSADIARTLRNTPEGMSIYKATGTPIHAMSPLCKLIWMRENDPDLFQTAHKFISIKEYIWYQIFREFKIDESIASCTGLYNIYKHGWHSEALELAGIADEQLSLPVSTDYFKLYEGKSLDFLQAGVPLVIGASDGCLANLGSMAYKPGVAVMTIGTSGAVRITSDRPLTDDSAMPFSYILDKQTFICGGPINNGGIVWKWWLKISNPSELNELDFIEASAVAAKVPAGSGGLLFLPYLTGERAPIWDSESCGVFFGIKLSHNAAHFSRAVLEGICYAMNDVLCPISNPKSPISQISVNGGFIKSKLWLQVLADITGKKLLVAHAEDASAIGAAYVAMKAVGAIDEYPMSENGEIDVYHPIAENAALYSQHFEIFRQLYSDLKKTMADIHRVAN